MSSVTRILHAIDAGDEVASEKLLPLVYEELRKLAASKLSREAPNQSLQPTVLVHEAYLRLVDTDEPKQWDGRKHFLGAAAEAMRRILIDNARRKKSQKRGGKLKKHGFGDIEPEFYDRHEELLELNDALTRLEERWPDRAQLVKLRFFAGLTVPEASETMGISEATGGRYWRFARAWLHGELQAE